MIRGHGRTALAAALLGLLLAGGCTTAIPAREFLSKYTTNINVPNPDRPQLPCRVFLGESDGVYYLKDSIPFQQGGGLLGTTTMWCCPAAELPEDFPEAYRPGDTIIDGRPGARSRYLIESFSGSASRPSAPKG